MVLKQFLYGDRHYRERSEELVGDIGEEDELRIVDLLGLETFHLLYAETVAQSHTVNYGVYDNDCNGQSCKHIEQYCPP